MIQHSPNRLRMPAALTVAGLALAGLSLPVAANAAVSTSAPVVVSEVYGGGGNSGAPFNRDFIELQNTSGHAVDLSGWSVQYASASGSSWAVTSLGSRSLAAGGRLLVGESGGSTGQPITADAERPLALSATAGKVALVDSTTPLVGATQMAAQAHVVDYVGWGTATDFAGAAAPATSNSTSIARNAAGTNTVNNAADFRAGAPTPAGGGATDPGTDPGTPVTLSIAQIQGSGDTSPYVGQNVTTEGVVTADYRTGGFNGFYLETGGAGGSAADDLTPGMSDAVFVYGSVSAGQVSVGDSVSVTGKVQEFSGTTEITAPTVTKLGAPLAAVKPDTLPWTGLTSDAQKEAHEGELIAPQGPFTVTDNYDANRYGSFTLAVGTTPLRQPTDVGTPGSPEAQAAVAENAARTITLDDGASTNFSSASNTGTALPWLDASHAVSIGAAVAFHQPLVLEYRNSEWNLQPTAQVTGDGSDVATFADQRAANQQPQNTGGDARLATFNVQNYFPMTGAKFVDAGLGTCTWYNDREGNHITVNRCTTTDGGSGPRGAADEASFLRQQQKIVAGINRLGASIVSLEEVENSVKFGEPRDTALAGLVDALNAAAGATVWAYIPSPSADRLPPLSQQDVIRTAFIYKPGAVTPVGTSTVLTDKSGPGQSFSIARQPLAQAFKRANATDADAFLVVANHWKSKGSGAPLYPGDAEDTSSPAVDQGAFNATRVQEAKDTVAFADDVAAKTGTSRIFLLGDLNAYTHEDPLTTLYDSGYTDLASTYAPDEHTYAYNGLQGSLDHVLANSAALSMVTGADVWQINAQESIAYNYSRFNYNVTQLFNGADPFAASDHDPEVVGLTLPAPAAWKADVAYDTGDLVTYDGSIWRARFYTKGDTPGSSKKIVWEQLATAPDGSVEWTATRVFTAGDIVEYDGVKYVAQWWTQGDVPGAAAKKQPWKVLG